MCHLWGAVSPPHLDLCRLEELCPPGCVTWTCHTSPRMCHLEEPCPPLLLGCATCGELCPPSRLDLCHLEELSPPDVSLGGAVSPRMCHLDVTRIPPDVSPGGAEPLGCVTCEKGMINI